MIFSSSQLANEFRVLDAGRRAAVGNSSLRMGRMVVRPPAAPLAPLVPLAPLASISPSSEASSRIAKAKSYQLATPASEKWRRPEAVGRADHFQIASARLRAQVGLPT